MIVLFALFSLGLGLFAKILAMEHKDGPSGMDYDIQLHFADPHLPPIALADLPAFGPQKMKELFPQIDMSKTFEMHGDPFEEQPRLKAAFVYGCIHLTQAQLEQLAHISPPQQAAVFSQRCFERLVASIGRLTRPPFGFPSTTTTEEQLMRWLDQNIGFFPHLQFTRPCETLTASVQTKLLKASSMKPEWLADSSDNTSLWWAPNPPDTLDGSLWRVYSIQKLAQRYIWTGTGLAKYVAQIASCSIPKTQLDASDDHQTFVALIQEMLRRYLLLEQLYLHAVSEGDNAVLLLLKEHLDKMTDVISSINQPPTTKLATLEEISMIGMLKTLTSTYPIQAASAIPKPKHWIRPHHSPSAAMKEFKNVARFEGVLSPQADSQHWILLLLERYIAILDDETLQGYIVEMTAFMERLASGDIVRFITVAHRHGRHETVQAAIRLIAKHSIVPSALLLPGGVGDQMLVRLEASAIRNHFAWVEWSKSSEAYDTKNFVSTAFPRFQQFLLSHYLVSDFRKIVEYISQRVSGIYPERDYKTIGELLRNFMQETFGDGSPLAFFDAGNLEKGSTLPPYGLAAPWMCIYGRLSILLILADVPNPIKLPNFYLDAICSKNTSSIAADLAKIAIQQPESLTEMLSDARSWPFSSVLQPGSGTQNKDLMGQDERMVSEIADGISAFGDEIKKFIRLDNISAAGLSHILYDQ